MNKILMITSCVLLFSSVALAEETTTETCANGAGFVLKGAVTGHAYCVSNNIMNWWNAVAWCDGLKRELASRADCACSDTTGNCADRRCPEFWWPTASPLGNAHLKDPHDSERSWYVMYEREKSLNDYYTRNTIVGNHHARALCK